MMSCRRRFPFAFAYPAFDKLRYYRDALAGGDLLLKPLQRFCRKRVGSFCHFHGWYYPIGANQPYLLYS